METPKLGLPPNIEWTPLDLVHGDQEISFVCPNCAAGIRFPHDEASRENPEATCQFHPLGETVRLTNGVALFFSQIPDRQPLIRGLSLVIGLATAALLMWWFGNTIQIEWIAIFAALFGGWLVVRLVQPALSPKLTLWWFNCPECEARYYLAIGTKGRIGPRP